MFIFVRVRACVRARVCLCMPVSACVCQRAQRASFTCVCCMRRGCSQARSLCGPVMWRATRCLDGRRTAMTQQTQRPSWQCTVSEASSVERLSGPAGLCLVCGTEGGWGGGTGWARPPLPATSSVPPSPLRAAGAMASLNGAPEPRVSGASAIM